MDKTLYTLIVHSENIAGLLNQITAVFTRRQINIESLNVSASSIKGVHKYTITVWTTQDVIEKVVKQIEKKIDVLQAHYFTDSRNQTTVLEFDKPIKNEEHPTMKPIDLLAYLIKNSSKENELILDLFGGSGSTLIAAEQTNRKCYMMELDPKYCDVIIRRWEKLTGQKAELEKSNGGG